MAVDAATVDRLTAPDVATDYAIIDESRTTALHFIVVIIATRMHFILVIIATRALWSSPCRHA